jgi:protein-tyrosine phosphatase
MPELMRILMVCLGNICRSPLAEGIMREKAKNWPVQPYVDSAGTGGWHAGEAPDQRSIAVASRYGIDISMQKARKFRLSDFSDFDFIFAMDRSNLNDILSIAPEEHSAKVHLLLNYAGKGLADVPDPWYGDETDFESVYLQLNEALEVIESKLQEENKS